MRPTNVRANVGSRISGSSAKPTRRTFCAWALPLCTGSKVSPKLRTRSPRQVTRDQLTSSFISATSLGVVDAGHLDRHQELITRHGFKVDRIGDNDRVLLLPGTLRDFAIDFQLIAFRVFKIDTFGDAVVNSPDDGNVMRL